MPKLAKRTNPARAANRPSEAYLPPIESGATFDPSGVYRYHLWRVWDRSKPTIGWILLNPSTADERQDDPTIRRCIRNSQRWGFGRVTIGNIFAIRATLPSVMRAAEDPIGPGNDAALRTIVSESSLLMVAWGNHGLHRDRGEWVMRNVLHGAQPQCLGITNLGAPIHPLYVAYDIERRAYRLPINHRPVAERGSIAK
ncbi:MAG: DUF1643 domain-containing protein [Phycisphaerae bacterium]